MLLTTLEELEAIYPTSRWDNIRKLLPLFSKVERTKLSRYLGMPLLLRLNADYKEICDAEGGITAIHIDDDYAAHAPLGTESDYPTTTVPDVSNVSSTSGGAEAPTLNGGVTTPSHSTLDDSPTLYTHLPFVLDVLRSCQEVIVYITLSNNVRILTSSLNQGGGFNVMVTEDYDQSNDTQLKALSQELWRNAMDSLDSLLILLEQDAKSSKMYTDLWKESQYYYMHSDLIFRTAEELSHYIPLDGGRAAFITLTPGLRNAQNQYIETRIGADLLQHLISDTLPGSSQEGGAAAPTPLSTVPPDLWRTFSRHVRQALANYANIEMLRLKGSTDKNSTQSRARSEMQNDYHEYGDREMGLALDVLFSHPQEFSDVIAASTILQYEYQRKAGQSWQQYLLSVAPPSPTEPIVSASTCSCSPSPRKSRSSLCDLGGWHTM